MLLLCRGYRALIELLGLGVLALYCVSCRLAAEADVVASLLVGTIDAEDTRDRPISRFCGGAGAPAGDITEAHSKTSIPERPPCAEP